MNSLLEYLVRGIGLMASLGLFLLTVVVTVYAFVEGGFVVAEILQFSSSEQRVIYDTMTVVDLFLLGFSVLIASVGIYELFVGVLPNMPGWLRVEDLESLKAVLIKTVIVVLGISFMGRAVTWNGEENLIYYGIAIGVVIAALSFFLGVKSEGGEKTT
jgi:Predicted membrane protein